MGNIKPNIGLGDNAANLREWKQLFGELAQGYIDPAEPRKLAPDEGWGAGTGKLLHKYFFDMPVGALKAMGDLYERGMKNPEAIPPLDYTASTLDAMLAGMPGGGSGVANIGKRDALRSLGRSGVKLSKLLNAEYDTIVDGKATKLVIGTPRKDALLKVKESLQGLNQLSQKELDRVSNVIWKKVETPEYGSYTPGSKEVTLTDNLMEAYGEKEAYDTLFHEFTHARQWSPDRKISEIIKARALRKASGDMPYRIRPVEQLARETARRVVDDGMDFERSYVQNLDAYLRTAKLNKGIEVASKNEPYQDQWSRLEPALREGIELAKKLPEAKKKILKLRSIADKARQSRELLMKKNAPIDMIQRAENIVSEANKRQVPYYQYLNELGLELK